MSNADQIYKPGMKLTKKAIKGVTIQQVRELLSGSSKKVILISIDQSMKISLRRSTVKGNGNAIGCSNTVASTTNDVSADLRMQVLLLRMKMDLLQMNATNYQETKERLTSLLDSHIFIN